MYMTMKEICFPPMHHITYNQVRFWAERRWKVKSKRSCIITLSSLHVSSKKCVHDKYKIKCQQASCVHDNKTKIQAHLQANLISSCQLPSVSYQAIIEVKPTTSLSWYTREHHRRNFMGFSFLTNNIIATKPKRPKRATIPTQMKYRKHLGTLHIQDPKTCHILGEQY